VIGSTPVPCIDVASAFIEHLTPQDFLLACHVLRKTGPICMARLACLLYLIDLESMRWERKLVTSIKWTCRPDLFYPGQLDSIMVELDKDSTIIIRGVS